MTTTALVRPRTWGDGLTTRYQHKIADIAYSRTGPSWLVCGCGKRFESPTPEGLALLWKGHGGLVLEVHVATDPADVYSADDTDNAALLAAVTALRRACTCETTAIEDCPNYQPGDERDE